jgi:cysteine desulfurase / selenocysteine lyase
MTSHPGTGYSGEGPSWIHVNTAAVGQLYPRAARAMRLACKALAHEGFYLRSYRPLFAAPERFRSMAARLLGGPDDGGLEACLALTANTSEGVAAVIEGYGHCLGPGDVVAINCGSFVSIPLALHRLSQRGVEILEVGSHDGLVIPEDLARVPRLKFCVIDWVCHRTGVRNPIQALAEYCAGATVPLLVDAAQGLGAVSLDFDLHLVAAMACSGHKWLRGPEGTGFLYINPQFLGRLTPGRHGYRSLRDPSRFDDPQPLELTDEARMLEVGTVSTVGFVGGCEALAQLLDHGPAQQATELEQLNDRIQTLLRRASGVEVVTPLDPACRAGIISFRYRDRPAIEVVKALSEVRVAAGSRGGLVRLSPAADVNSDLLCERLVSVLGD